MKKTEADLRELLKDAHVHFFMMKGTDTMRLKLWEIREDSLVIETPVGAPMRKSMVGIIPTLDGSGVYEIAGTIDNEPLPDQMSGTLRLKVVPEGVRKLNRRMYPRVSFTPPIPVNVTPEGVSRSIDGRIVNLSAGGLRVETSEELPADRPIAFRFDIELDDEIHSVARIGNIVYVVPMQIGFAYGVRFGADEEDTLTGDNEAPITGIEKTVDLIALVNKLLVRR